MHDTGRRQLQQSEIEEVCKTGSWNPTFLMGYEPREQYHKFGKALGNVDCFEYIGVEEGHYVIEYSDGKYIVHISSSGSVSEIGSEMYDNYFCGTIIAKINLETLEIEKI